MLWISCSTIARLDLIPKNFYYVFSHKYFIILSTTFKSLNIVDFFSFFFFWCKVWNLAQILLHLLRYSMRSRWVLCSGSHWTPLVSALKKWSGALTPPCRQLKFSSVSPSLCWHLPSKCVTLIVTALLILSECGGSELSGDQLYLILPHLVLFLSGRCGQSVHCWILLTPSWVGGRMISTPALTGVDGRSDPYSASPVLFLQGNHWWASQVVQQ